LNNFATEVSGQKNQMNVLYPKTETQKKKKEKKRRKNYPFLLT
jgi:hypothetical protein